MAISDLEQRLVPLQETGCWLPFGALRIPPWLEHEILEEDPLLTVSRSRRRCRTWAGYCPYRVSQFVDGKPAERDEVHASEYSNGCDAGLPEGQTCCPQFPEFCNDGFGKAVGSRSMCNDSDCETQTPESRSSSYSSCGHEEDDCESPFHVSSCGGEGDTPKDTVELPEPMITTLMVQNLSRTLTRRGLLDVLNGCGFADRYDFVHLPMTFGSGKNKGFAFINFVCPEAAEEFAGRFPRSDGTQIKDKTWRVAQAAVQGFEANATAASSRKVARVRNSACRPLLVVPGRATADMAPPTLQEAGRKNRANALHRAKQPPPSTSMCPRQHADHFMQWASALHMAVMV